MAYPHLAVEISGPGAHPAAAGPPGAAFDPDELTRVARLADDAGFALVTLDDSAQPSGGGIEAGVRAAYLALRTQTIGLAPALHVTTTEPFHLATQLASLDIATHGRAAWLVSAQNSAAALATVGREPLAVEALREEVRDVIEVGRQLWDSWEDDAIIKDVATGQFLDPDRVHHINFVGDTFSVIGPLITPRPPQGQVVVLGADTLGVTGQLDIALVDGIDLERQVSRARRDGAPRVFAELDVLLGTDESAQTRLEALDARTPWGPPTRLRHVGSPEALRDLLRRLAEHVDGVRLHPAVLDVDLPGLVEQLNGLGPLRGATLRETLRLPRPINRFATSSREVTAS
ncbi:LLM class flavin-dependent oxidoreductase [Cryptosporangium arvum]|uniref:Flavin-dependent oxidoreductase, F420-dependent methylene-tetrahydromethanopterin reductase n=1 Tax=Cryptosporangium arvum DSM 44712 TaxID=927661 RepID=A0A010Z4B7_9ACTN|nr:LLM class flavin-dependent oxidoreductase [Cryptosporangium arvum]EXG82223.1 flavin-dependent oxidoreductase, F420-dependent methylene-tetrahydromethanopterin reductase [Cryptosporangium arvum DSM 44712]